MRSGSGGVRFTLGGRDEPGGGETGEEASPPGVLWWLERLQVEKWDSQGFPLCGMTAASESRE